MENVLGGGAVRSKAGVFLLKLRDRKLTTREPKHARLQQQVTVRPTFLELLEILEIYEVLGVFFIPLFLGALPPSLPPSLHGTSPERDVVTGNTCSSAACNFHIPRTTRPVYCCIGLK